MKPIAALRGTWKGYLFALVVSVVIMLLKVPLSGVLGLDSPLLLFPIAVLLAAWLGGLGPGLLATLFTTTATTYLFVAPAGSLLLDGQSLQPLLLFAGQSLIFCGLVFAAHGANNHGARTRQTSDSGRSPATKDRNSVGSERRLWLGLNAAPMVAWEWDPERDKVITTDNLRTVCGASSLENFEQVLQCVHPKDRATYQTKLQATARDGGSFQIVYRAIRPDNGETVWLEKWGYAEEDEHGKVQRLVGIVMDITRRKKTEEAYRRQAKMLQLSHDAIFVWRLDDGQVEFWNQGASELFGYTPEQATGRPVRELLRPQLAEPWVQIQETLHDKGTWEGKLYDTSRSGEQMVISSRMRLVEKADGSKVVIETSRDITEREKAEKRLRESEKRLRLALDAATMVAWEWNMESDQVEMTEKVQEVYGIPASQSPGDIIELVHPNDRRHRHHVIKEVTDNGGSYHLDFRIIRPDNGEVVWIEEWGHAETDEKGELQQLVGVAIDITDRKETEEAYRRQAKMLQLSHDAIFVWQLDGGIQFWNRGARELYGFTADEATGQDAHNLLRSQLPEPWDHIERQLRQKGIWEGEVRHTSKNGGEIVVSTRKQLVIEPDGRLVVLETNRDVTEQRQYEKGLEQARSEAEKLAQAKTSLLANMSHEVRTPLTGLLIMAEVLTSRLKGKNRDTVVRMKKGAEKLSDLLDAVLTLSRLEAGHVEINREPLEIVEEVWQAVAPLKPLAEKKNLQLIVEGEPPCCALVDESSLDSVLNNLIGNAIKFTDEGSVTVEIGKGRDQRVSGSAVLIRVRDTGSGISPEFLPHIFEDFRQESTGNTRTHGGAGLGLAISKRLVDLMGGVIEVESELGEGTTFTITLPATNEAESVCPAAEESAIKPNGHRPRVLFMDDDELTRELVPDLLESMYQVTQASTPQEALDLASSEDFDAVLLDISMGEDRTGEDVLHALRQEPAYRKKPIIAVTAYALPGDETRFLREGFDDYVSKPFQGAELANTLQEALSAAAQKA